MKLTHIKYSDLNSKQKEIYNFQKVASLLANYGFNCIKLADDWMGADFLAYHKDKDSTLRVQLKSRFTIDKKYSNSGLYVVFPVRGYWYLEEHDALVNIVEKNTNWLKSESWLVRGRYSSEKPSKKLLAGIEYAKLQD